LPLGARVDTTARGYRVEIFFEDEEGPIQGSFDCDRLGDGLRAAFERLLRVPTGGPKVWLTAPLYQHGRLAKIANSYHQAVSTWPLIAPIPTWSFDEIKALVNSADDDRPLIFASPFASQLFVREVLALADEKWIKAKKIFAVGAQTAKPFQEIGVQCAQLPEEASARGLADMLALNASKQEYVLIGSQRSRIPVEFEKRNLKVQNIEVYDTRANQGPLALDVPLFHQRDIIAFSSPSAVDIFALHVAARPELRTLKVAAIGPSTAKVLRHHGFDPIENSVSGSWTHLFQSINSGK
jgi:uroporphyrinogen-III synthase